MKKINEYRKQMLSRKGVTLFGQISIIVLVLFIYILADYIKIDGSMKFATDPLYWITTTISLLLVISLMITVRAMHKERMCEQSQTINDNLFAIRIARYIILGNNFSELFQNDINKVNENGKVEAFVNKVTRKINNLSWKFWLTRKKKDKLLLKYEKMLTISRDEILKKPIAFKKVTQTGLFSGVDGKVAVCDRHDTSTHEARDISVMATKKALIVYLLTAFSGTLAVYFSWFGIAALWGTLLKLFALALAIVSALKTAEDFVNYNVEQALDNRIRIIMDFINSHNEVKDKFLEKKSQEIKKTLDNN